MSTRKKEKIRKFLPVMIAVLVTICVVTFGYLKFSERNSYFIKSAENSVVKKTPTDEIEDGKIYISGNKSGYIIYLEGNEESYIGYNLERMIKTPDKNIASSNYDLWKINTASEYEYVDDLNRFSFKNKLITTGEWEMAIKESGTSDFVGGSLHGDEVMTSYNLTIDGIDYTEKSFKNSADNFTLHTESELYRDNTITDDLQVIATHIKDYVFDVNGLTITQSVVFHEPVKIENSYLAMLPVSRNYSNKATINGVEYDLATINNSVDTIKTDSVTITDSDNRVESTVRVIESGAIGGSSFWIWNTDNYNKIYGSYAADGYTTSVGEEWHQATHYDININY